MEEIQEGRVGTREAARMWGGSGLRSHPVPTLGTADPTWGDGRELGVPPTLYPGNYFLADWPWDSVLGTA
jgi:hypothetical protein